MSWARAFAAAVVFASLLGTPAAADLPRVRLAERFMAERLFERVNDERAERGLRPLEWSQAAAAAARTWSARLGRSGRLAHSTESWRTDRIAGHERISVSAENVFYGGGPRARFGRAHRSWMQSDLHRRNLLHRQYDAVGIGVRCANGVLWATLIVFSHDTPPAEMSRAIPPEEPIARPKGKTMGCRPGTWPDDLGLDLAHKLP